MKRSFTVLITIMVIFTMATGMCFATTGSLGSNNVVPVMLNLQAIGLNGSGIDFTINDTINMTAASGDCNLVIDSLVITNNSSAGQLKVDSMEITPKVGWSINKDDKDYFANLKAGTKQFSMICDGHDFGETSKAEYGETKLVPASGNLTFDFSGHIGVFKSTFTDHEVASAVVTVSVY